MKLVLLTLCLLMIGCVALAQVHFEPVQVTLTVDKTEVGMGRTITLMAEARYPDGTPAVGAELLPYANGARWGNHAYADAEGKAVFHIPLPNPGLTELLVQARPAPGQMPERWIWAPELADNQTVFLQQSFNLEATPESADLWFAVDDVGKLWLNGELIHEYVGWHDMKAVPVPTRLLKPGRNVLSAECHNGSGPAGLLLRLELKGPGQQLLVTSDAGWRAFEAAPAGWPDSAEGGAPVKEHGGCDTGAAAPDKWPGLSGRMRLFAGSLLPEDANVSNTVTLRVLRRQLEAMPFDPDHRVGVQWEPWFTPHNPFWQTAEAVPVIGYYQSYNQSVTRQHVIWLMEAGVDFWMADWSNHIWFSPTWDSRGENCNEIIHSTSLALETLAVMREEGLPVPQFTLLAGISHVEGGERAVNEMLDWVYHNYIRNPRFAGLWLEFEGKPLVTLLNLGHSYMATGKDKLVDPEGHFTLRYVSAQNDKTRENELGLWSWMDTGAMVTYKDGVAEAVTAAFGYFDSGGWTKAGAAGLRGGATFLETMRVALDARPQVLFLHQFNEFAGQAEGAGHGENKDNYYDTYSAELTDDYEPTALDTPGYRSPQGGWGYFYLNLQAAVIDLYKQAMPETTVLVLESPRRLTEADASLPLKWQWIGLEPETFTIFVDGKEVASGLRTDTYQLDTSGLAEGRHTVKLVAPGTASRYLLSWTEASPRLETPVPAEVEVEFVVKRG